MDSIAKEEMELKRYAEMERELRNASDKADEALRMAEAAMNLSFNVRGHVDQDRLPREVELKVNEERRRYQLLKHVGSGCKGTVFEAKLIDEDSDNGKLTVKICGADESGRVKGEALDEWLA